VEYLGRVDQQVKIRGQRVELGEIESVLLELAGVRAAAAHVHRTEAGEPDLVAYVEADEGLAAADLVAGLRGRLPETMTPRRVVVLDKLPLTANGKLDRSALPRPPPEARRSEPPRTPLEARLARAWSEVLGHAGVGRDDNFFDLGGHSITAIRLANRINSDLDIDLELVEVFHRPTPAALAAFVLEEFELDDA
jgi:acyl carrier protein